MGILLWPISKKFFNGSLGGHYSSIGYERSWIWCLLLIWRFKFFCFDVEMGVATTLAQNVPEPQSRVEKLAHWNDLLGRLLSRNNVTKIIRPEIKSMLNYLRNVNPRNINRNNEMIQYSSIISLLCNVYLLVSVLANLSFVFKLSTIL